MSPTLDAFLGSWPFDPWLLATLLLSAGIYLRGWHLLCRRDPGRWPLSLPAAFVGGLLAIYLALASPIEPFAALLLQVHMIQHLLLMMVAPPLLWLGAPLLPAIRGMPEGLRTYWVAPVLRSRRLRTLFRRATHPASALPLFVVSTWFWHVPAIYETTLQSARLHYVQHACFLASALLFWYPVVRPYPGRPRWSLWLLFPYLILADVQNTVLSALLTFSNRVLYPHYAQVPRVWGVSALDDQSAAGVLMWVPGSVAFLLPLFAIALKLLFGKTDREMPSTPRPRRVVVRSGTPAGGWPLLPVLNEARAPQPSPGFDLLRLPVLGPFLRWRHARSLLQIPLLLLALAIVVDGLRGPQVGALNLAGVLPWIHWRGLVVLGLLAAGNVSCMACPFLLPRTIARRWLPAGRRWPRSLRSKWPAVVLIALFLWSYEAFSLWDRPGWTACLVIAYFVAAFVIDGLFRGASFCKYVCPIGQFNFVQSQISPLEVTVRDPDVCATCRTRDCIRGRDGIAGCELGLFQPRKVGNLDCTFCLDCVHSCPHENVGILAALPGRALGSEAPHSGIGRLNRRPDLAALILILVFGAFANAAGMVGPVLELQARLNARAGWRSPLAMTSLYYFLAILTLPLLLQGSAAHLSRNWGGLATSTIDVATRFSYALVPLGFSMWLSHYSYHFLTSYGTLVPSAQRFARDFGWEVLGVPEWGRACCRPVSDWLLRLEILALDFGMLFSLYIAYRIALSQTSKVSRALMAFAPWAILIALLFSVGAWIVFQPMQMRGTLPGAG